MGKKIIVIGGAAAGPKAAARARRMDEFAEITMFQKGPDLSMASCGYPYFVGGFFDDRNKLLCTPTGIVRDPKFYWNAKGIDAKVNLIFFNPFPGTSYERPSKNAMVKLMQRQLIYYLLLVLRVVV